MGRVASTAKWTLAAIGAALTLASRVAPEDAATHLREWAGVFGIANLSWRVPEQLDIWSLWIGAALLATALLLWLVGWLALRGRDIPAVPVLKNIAEVYVIKCRVRVNGRVDRRITGYLGYVIVANPSRRDIGDITVACSFHERDARTGWWPLTRLDVTDARDRIRAGRSAIYAIGYSFDRKRPTGRIASVIDMGNRAARNLAFGELITTRAIGRRMEILFRTSRSARFRVRVVQGDEHVTEAPLILSASAFGIGRETTEPDLDLAPDALVARGKAGSAEVAPVIPKRTTYAPSRGTMPGATELA